MGVPLTESQLAATLDEGAPLLASVREQLSLLRTHLDQRFVAGDDIRTLVCERARHIDTILRCIWTHLGLSAHPGIALVAVGGYGRGELHPHSDVDVLVLLEAAEIRGANAAALESFITFLWDTGLAIGHSVRTIEECRAAALADITIATSIMEARIVAGEGALLERLSALTGPDQIWPSARFFRAKWDEQIARHRKFNNTEYNLEPNIKGCPGGLRDVQTVGWVAKRHFRASSTLEPVSYTHLTPPTSDLV